MLKYIQQQTFVITASHQQPAFQNHEPKHRFTKPSLQPPTPVGREILARAGIEVLPELNVKTYPNTVHILKQLGSNSSILRPMYTFSF